MRRAVIIGRPNVGKSALFNRLAGRKIAIVHNQPGVTRDRLSAVCTLGREPFEIVDTGGICATPDPDFADHIHLAAQIAIESADAILFTVDAQEGFTPADQEAADLLRHAAKPVILVVNKVDTPAHESLAADFARLGFSTMCPVSSAHGRGIPALVDALEAAFSRASQTNQESRRSSATAGSHPPALQPALSAKPSEISSELRPPPADDLPRLAIVGRPNAGKSSLTNALLGMERSLVSPLPGTTRDAVDATLLLDGQLFRLCDTAGLRHRSKHNTSVEVFSAMRAERSLAEADLCILVLDAAQGVTAQDKKIARLIHDRAKAAVIALNKADLLLGSDGRNPISPGSRSQLLKEAAEQTRARLHFLKHAPVIPLSAKTGTGLPALRRAITRIHDQAFLRIGTGELNRWLQKTLERHTPPARGTRRLKIYYATQVVPETPRPFAPIRILLFANDPKLCPDSYAEYLENAFRHRWPCHGLALQWLWRARPRAPTAPSSQRPASA